MAFYKLELPQSNDVAFTSYVAAALGANTACVAHVNGVMNAEDPKLTSEQKAPLTQVVKKIRGAQYWLLGQVADRFSQLDDPAKQQATNLLKALDGHWTPDWLLGKCARVGILISTERKSPPADLAANSEEDEAAAA